MPQLKYTLRRGFVGRRSYATAGGGVGNEEKENDSCLTILSSLVVAFPRIHKDFSLSAEERFSQEHQVILAPRGVSRGQRLS